MSHAFDTSHAPCEKMNAHWHSAPYAALVLDGSYEERSVDGRFECSAGILTLHPRWHSHSNCFGRSGATVLNIPLPEADGLTSLKVSNVREIEKLARRSPVAAGQAILEEAQQHQPLTPATWLLSLVQLIFEEPETDIATIAHRCGVTPAHASRACTRWFGQGPAALKRDARLRHAIALLHAGAMPSEAALDAGFSDQPHLTRVLKRHTGLTPGKLRVS